MKDIEKLLQEELSNIVPSMSEELRNHPITSREKKPVFIPWKLVISVCSLVMIAVLAISLSILNPSTPGSQIGTTTTPTETIPVENEYSYYLIQINPKILIKTNNGEVLDVKPLNNDAIKLLENIKDTIKNSQIIDSINLIAQKAVEQGYISNEAAKTINISAIEGSSDEIFNCITNAFEEYFTSNGFNNVVVDKNDNKITIEDYCNDNNIDIDDFDQYFDNLPSTHNHSYESEITTHPACEEAGVRTYTCACGDTYTEVIPATGHNTVSHEALAPTCEAAGHNAYEECLDCDYTTYEEIPALKHDYDAVVTAPTCTNDGYTTYTCTNDSTHTYVDNIVEAKGHSYESEITTHPACETAGVRTYTCECGDAYTEEIPATGHNTVSHEALAPTCEAAGYKEYETCTDCDYTTYEEIPALKHDYEAVVTAPTCINDGYTTYTCKNDSTHTYVGNYVEAEGHKPSDVVIENNVEPTEDLYGYYDNVIYCNECKEELSRETIIVDKLEPSVKPEEIEGMYNEELSKYTYDLLVNNIDIIKELNDIVTIINDNSNSLLNSLFKVNYWEIDDEFRDLIEDMYPNEIEAIRANSNRYKEATGVDIISLEQFNEIYNTITSLRVSQIENLISQYENTGECQITAFTMLDSLVNVINLYNSESAEKLYNVYNYQKPTTMDEYNEFLNIIK